MPLRFSQSSRSKILGQLAAEGSEDSWVVPRKVSYLFTYQISLAKWVMYWDALPIFYPYFCSLLQHSQSGLEWWQRLTQVLSCPSAYFDDLIRIVTSPKQHGSVGFGNPPDFSGRFTLPNKNTSGTANCPKHFWLTQLIPDKHLDRFELNIKIHRFSMELLHILQKSSIPDLMDHTPSFRSSTPESLTGRGQGSIGAPRPGENGSILRRLNKHHKMWQPLVDGKF